MKYKFSFKKYSISSESAFSLIELIITLAILAMLAAAALPLATNTVRRNREIELRRSLRQLRTAIDEYKKFNDETIPPGQKIPIQERTPTGYPKKLDILVEGFVPANIVDNKKKIFLRRLPVDPMTGDTEWGVRSFTDDPDSESTNGEDVFDVYSRSDATGLNGTKYKEW
jgi:general secretion pathway protein G